MQGEIIGPHLISRSELIFFFLCVTDSKISHKYGETARQQHEHTDFHHRAQSKAALPKSGLRCDMSNCNITVLYRI